ncbi:hypothetical protein HHI36_020538, partial [Cryptolaemus montrouzieri]
MKPTFNIGFCGLAETSFVMYQRASSLSKASLLMKIRQNKVGDDEDPYSVDQVLRDENVIENDNLQNKLSFLFNVFQGLIPRISTRFEETENVEET